MHFPAKLTSATLAFATLVASDTNPDWGGGVRWLVDPEYNPREALANEDGHATLMKFDELPAGIEIFQPLTEPVLGIHQRLKRQFDPVGIFNPGRMYRDI